ncbi:MAG: caspase family protein [Armatimonadota bacterium]
MRKISPYIFLIIPFLIIVLFSSLSCSGGGGGGVTYDTSTISFDLPTPIAAGTPEPANKGELIYISKNDGSAYAVLAGVTDYPEGENDLNFTANDAINMMNSLSGNDFWSTSTVTRYSDVHVTKSMIQNAIQTAQAALNNGGLFIFMYSGHGAASGSTGYLVPFNGVYSESECISEGEMQGWLSNFDASIKKCILLDACFSGSFINKRTDSKTKNMVPKFIKLDHSDTYYENDKYAKSLLGIPNCYVMTSSRGSEVSYEDYNVQGGVFVHYIHEALGDGNRMGPADSNGDIIITEEDLTNYVPSQVRNYTEWAQNPQVYDNYTGSFTVKSGSKGTIITIAKADSSAYAVLVGVRDYENGRTNDLSFTVNDAVDLKDSLLNSTFWSGATVSIQNNIQVNKSMIETAVNNAKNNIANSGLFVFMFSGHGTNSNGLGYLIPYGGTGGAANCISENDLRSWLNNFNSSVKKYVLLDSCYSGYFIDKSLSTGLIPKTIAIDNNYNSFYSSEKFAKTLVGLSNCCAMTSSKGSEVSYEDIPLQNGVFGYYVAQALGTGATIGPADTNSSGSITALEMGNYVSVYVSSYTSGVQNPQTYDNYSGELRVK